MLASLPMYDLPEVRAATDAFWAALAKFLGASGGLSREPDWTALWRNPALLFSQTCGYPFTHAFAGQLTYVATPHYEADGCEGPNYRSLVFAREAAPLEFFRGKVAAFNNRDSMSGMLALKLMFAPAARAGRFFAKAMESGGHAASLAAVQSGDADVCAVDCVTVALLRMYRPHALAGLVEIARSPLVPGLPFVTRTGQVPLLQYALQRVLAMPEMQHHAKTMLLRGITVLPSGTYDIIPQLEREMQAGGGLMLDTAEGVAC